MHKTKNIIYLAGVLIFASCSSNVPVDIIPKKVYERLSKYQENKPDNIKVVRLLYGKDIVSDKGEPLFVCKDHEIKIDKIEILNTEEIKISDVTKIRLKVEGSANIYCLKRKPDHMKGCYIYSEEEYGERKFENTFYAIFWKEDSDWNCDLSIW